MKKRSTTYERMDIVMKKYLKLFSTTVLILVCITVSAGCGSEAVTTQTETTNEEVITESFEDTVESTSEEQFMEELSAEDETEGQTEEQPIKEPEPYVDKMDRSDEGFELVWNDEFDGDVLDTTKWDYQYGNGGEYGNPGWGNNEVQYYLNRQENIRVEDGKLIITAIKEDSIMPYTSARIRTITNRGDVLFATTYGRVEARIKMPAEEALWPAFWMLPVDTSTYGAWAASGEIDIMEAKGRLSDQFSAACHFGRTWPNNTYQNKEYTFQDGTNITDFHLYSIEWEPDEIRWYLDNECYFTLKDWYSEDASGTAYEKPAPFDVPFYIILNLAVGGTFDPQADLDNAEFPAEMEVDFVRVYHKAEGYADSALE